MFMVVLSSTNKLGTVGIDIYRKPTTTDIVIVISNSSCHPGEQKMATFKNWLHRLHKLPLNELNKEKEKFAQESKIYSHKPTPQ
jgi:hypothetical protein